ncbi:MAG: DUF4276 family protein [Treponema sp.]|nr:DUF4276 family protein [Candidatus Treponema caballi]
MIKIDVICEGQSEAEFIKQVLQPAFDNTFYRFIPQTVVTSTDKRKGRVYKGGVSSFSKVEKDISNAMASVKAKNAFVTTMFDFYALPSDTPGFEEAKKLGSVYDKVACIENAMKVRFNAECFIPYIQIHELETFQFADLNQLKTIYFEYQDKFGPLEKCVKEFSNIEMINNGPETAPSKRILECIPDYDKVLLGIEAMRAIDFSVLRKKCSHFNEWITQLEQLKEIETE